MLFLIPNMYSIARDERAYLGESYCRIAFRTLHDYSLKRQLSVGNIGDYSKAFPTALELLTPNFYDECLYERYILSPFHRVNQKLYRYKVNLIGNGLATVKFTPRIKNTQLVEGTAYVNYETGCISTVELRGEYDTVDFKLSVQQGGQPAYSPNYRSPVRVGKNPKRHLTDPSLAAAAQARSLYSRQSSWPRSRVLPMLAP